MKPKNILQNTLLSALLILLSSLSLQAMELGDVSLAGNGCYGSTIITPVSAVRGRISLPVRASLNKKAGLASFERSTCNIRIPVKLAPNEKLQILDVAQSVRLSVSAGAEVKSNLNLTLVGRRTPDLTLVVKAEDNNITTAKVLKTEKSVVIAESNCGQDTIIAGNLSLLAVGQSGASATTSSVKVTLKVLSCEE
ncbi:MAG: hypothetical protein AABY53_00290 [Bdellovibrionota bacterium]